MWDIQEAGSNPCLSIQAAHSDHVKKVQYFGENFFISASSDKTVKLWDVRQTSAAVSTITLENPVEDFCLAQSDQIVVAHGNTLSMGKLSEGGFGDMSSFYPFQKAI
jgi:WD40 repeat protein